MYQTPLAAIMLILVIPFIEPVIGEDSALDPERSFYEYVSPILTKKAY
jgi:hypothetical protein